MNKIYTGIGSRKTPFTLKPFFKSVASTLATSGYTLRSGGASGADQFFEAGATDKEIYLPWKGFEKSDSSLYVISNEAYKMAEKYHPAWHKCTAGARKMHARNCYQVLGYDLKTPTAFILCWTQGGKGTGGTAQALRIARDCDIPIHDFGSGNFCWEYLLDA